MDRTGLDDQTAADGRFERLWPLLFVLFLPNLAAPVTSLVGAHPSALRLWPVLAATAVFVGIYLWVAWHSELSRKAAENLRSSSAIRLWAPLAILIVLSLVLILGDGSRWLALLIFTSASVGGRLPLRSAVRTVATLTAFTAVLGWITHDQVADLGTAAFWTFVSGLLTIILSHFRRTNTALQAAREEITRLAVETERLRFARDLHDLLGHDLARIALQSEVAEALIGSAPSQAITAMRDVGSAARTALQEVRAAVAGYRQPTLASELSGASQILAAAAIGYHCEGERVAVPLTVEAVLAWTVREGVTNVVKHSRARHCTVRLTMTGDTAGVSVLDDGAGASCDPIGLSSDRSGSGLAGLAERAQAAGGICSAGPRQGGGFQVQVSVPIGQAGNGMSSRDRTRTESNATVVEPR